MPSFLWNGLVARRAQSMRASDIRELLKLLDAPDIISFAGGIPDPALFPMDTAREAFRQALAKSNRGHQSLQYSISEGYLPLREWLVCHMAGRGVPCEIDNIIITSGSQQGLDFLGKLLINEGGTVLVTAPTYLGALQAFNAYEPQYETLSLADSFDSAGVVRPSLAYVVPDFANPTGTTLDEATRRRLLRCTVERGIPLVEDAAYEALRFEGPAVRSCQALDIDHCGHIDRSLAIYCGTFSKTIAPGLRVGWICAAREVIQRLILAKQAADLHSATLNQIVMHRLAETTYGDQVDKITTVYARRRDVMLAALTGNMPSGVSWTRPEGGMFIWVTLPPELDARALLEYALREERVAFVPGQAFFADGTGSNTLRLNYSLPSESMIREGIVRLARAINRQVSGQVAPCAHATFA